MEIILLEKVRNLGELGDLVKVKPGYGRNFLIPNGKAVAATAANRKKFEARRAELEKRAQETLQAAQQRADRMASLLVTVSARAGEEGKLFGSVGAADIATAITEAGEAADKHEVRLPSGPLRSAGEHDVTLHLHPDVDVVVKVSVIAED